MLEITNQKVAGLEPTWAPFRGCSLLFNNPDNSQEQVGDTFHLSNPDAGGGASGFFPALWVGLQHLGLEQVVSQFALCPLPPASYHVTVWDGCNDANLSEVREDQQPTFNSFLEGLPGSLHDNLEFTRMISGSALVTEDWNIRWGYGELRKHWNSALLALLQPADPESAWCLDRLVAERQHLNHQFREAYGIAPNDTFRPHVTLGYFANHDLARSAEAYIAEWNQVIRGRVRTATLSVTDINLYGFTDMATFFTVKPEQPYRPARTTHFT